MMIFKFPNIPLSDNQLYINIPGQAKRFISAKGKAYKKDIESHTLEQIEQQDKHNHKYTEQIRSMSGEPLYCHILLTGSWFTKTNNIRVKDALNYNKSLIDSIFDALRSINPDLDDSQIFHATVTKLDNPDIEQTEIKLDILDPDDLDDEDNEIDSEINDV